LAARSASNATGLRAGKVVQNVFTLTKIAALLGLIAVVALVGALVAVLWLPGRRSPAHRVEAVDGAVGLSLPGEPADSPRPGAAQWDGDK